MRLFLRFVRLLIRLVLFPFRLPFFLYFRLTLLWKRPVLHLRFPDRFSLFEAGGWMERLAGMGGEEVNYFRFLMLLHRIRLSREIRTLIIELPPGIDDTLDWSQAFEIADELERIHDSGKQIIAHTSGGALRTLLLLSRADVRLASPSAHFLTALPHAEPFYYADLLSSIGVTIEVYHAGRYKSAGESLSRTGSSAPARENLTTILRGLRTLYHGRLETAPALEPDQGRKICKTMENRSLSTAEDLVKCGLLTGLVESAHLLEYARDGRRPSVRIQHKFAGPGDALDAPDAREDEGESKAPEAIDAIAFLRRENRRLFSPMRVRRVPAVALAVLHGTIVQGKDGDPARAGNVVAAAWRPILRELEEGDEEAVFVYIDSPGGSADASENLFQDLRRLSRKKPVFAIMGGAAASGGYFIACGANRIHASPVSLTGSIGVIRIRPQAGGLLKKLRVHSERMLFDDTTDVLSPTARISRRSRKLLEEDTAATYLDFLKRVAEGRGLTIGQVQKYAEGRVFLGAELRDSGLIDGLSGVLPLLERFREEAGYAADRPIEVRIVPELRFDLRKVLRAGLPFSPSRAGLMPLSELSSTFPALALLPSLVGHKPLYLLPFRWPT